MTDPPRRPLLDRIAPGGTGFPLLDSALSDGSIIGAILDDARKTARGKVVNRVVGDTVQNGLDSLMAARRRR